MTTLGYDRGMAWMEVLGSAAIGSLLGLLAKEGLDFLRSERAHRLELQRRYFDAKLNATIQIIRQTKTATASLRRLLSLIHSHEATPNYIRPEFFRSMGESETNALQQIQHETVGTASLLGFYFDHDVRALIEDVEPTALQVTQEFSKLMHYGDEREKARAVDPPTEESTFAVAFYDAAVRDQVTILLDQVNTVDQNSDRLVRRLRAEYERLDIFRPARKFKRDSRQNDR
jgi:hypothetical protein